MKGKIKANTVDKYLSPVRDQIVNLVGKNSNVIEFGCGNGDLLYKLSSKIAYGIGIDKSRALIAYANHRKKQEGITNIDFKIQDLQKEFNSSDHYDYAIASLLLHVMHRDDAKRLLKTMIAISKTVIICGFSKPGNIKQKILLWFDQRFSGHYTNFKTYKENEYMKGFLKTIQNIEYTCYDSFDPVIKLYEITKYDTDQ